MMMFILAFILSGTVAAAVVLLPAMAGLHCCMIRDFRRSALCTMFALYLGAVGAVVQLPCVFNLSFQPRLHLLPIIGMREDFVNSVLNVILFLPLGMFLPMLYDSFKNVKRAALYGFFMSLTIEVLQLFNAGITDVNDLITNTSGAVLGYLFWKFLTRRKDTHLAKSSNAREAAVITALALIAVTTVQPALRDGILKTIFS